MLEREREAAGRWPDVEGKWGCGEQIWAPDSTGRLVVVEMLGETGGLAACRTRDRAPGRGGIGESRDAEEDMFRATGARGSRGRRVEEEERRKRLRVVSCREGDERGGKRKERKADAGGAGSRGQCGRRRCWWCLALPPPSPLWSRLAQSLLSLAPSHSTAQRRSPFSHTLTLTRTRAPTHPLPRRPFRLAASF